MQFIFSNICINRVPFHENVHQMEQKSIKEEWPKIRNTREQLVDPIEFKPQTNRFSKHLAKSRNDQNKIKSHLFGERSAQQSEYIYTSISYISQIKLNLRCNMIDWNVIGYSVQYTFLLLHRTRRHTDTHTHAKQAPVALCNWQIVLYKLGFSFFDQFKHLSTMMCEYVFVWFCIIYLENKMVCCVTTMILLPLLVYLWFFLDKSWIWVFRNIGKWCTVPLKLPHSSSVLSHFSYLWLLFIHCSTRLIVWY